MNTLHFDNEDDLAAAFTEAASAFAPPAGLKETIRGRVFDQASQYAISPQMPRSRWSRRRRVLAVAVFTGLLFTVSAWLNWPENELARVAYAEFAEVVENTNRAEWVHFFEKDGREFWLSFHPYRSYCRTENGSIHALDRASNRSYRYDSATNTLTVSFAPNPGGWSAEFFGSFSDYLQIEIGQHEKDAQNIRKGTTRLDGKSVNVYVVPITHKEQKGEKRYFADPQTNRIVCVEMAGVGLMSWYKWRTRIDYPLQGPEDVFALGVPQDAEIVDRTPPRPVLELVGQVQDSAATRRVPNYQISVQIFDTFSVEYTPWFGAMVDLTYNQDGLKRVDRYGVRCPKTLSQQEAGRYLDRLNQEVPTSNLEDVEAWLATRKPYKIIITDGGSGQTVFQLAEDQTLTINNFQIPSGLLAWGLELDGNPTLLQDESPWGPLVGIENHDSSVKRHRWYFNPDRDYICQKTERLIRGTISKRTEVIEYDKNPNGQWFRKRLRRTEYGGRERVLITNFRDDGRKLSTRLFDKTKITAADLCSD